MTDLGDMLFYQADKPCEPRAKADKAVAARPGWPLRCVTVDKRQTVRPSWSVGLVAISESI